MEELPQFLYSESEGKKIVIHTRNPIVIGEIIFHYNLPKEICAIKISDKIEEKDLQELFRKMKDWYVLNKY